MKWEDHRSWVLGSIAAAVIAFAAAAFSVVYAAYYNRTHDIADWGALGTFLNTPVPLWFVFGLGVLAVWTGWKSYNLWRHRRFIETRLKVLDCRRSVIDVLKQQNRKLEEQLTEFRSAEPKIHGVWNVSQSYWHMGRHGNDPSMQICGRISLSTSNTDENLVLLAAYIGERRADVFTAGVVTPNVVQNAPMMLFFTPPLSENLAEPFTATIVLEDHKNRRYELPRFTFRATPGQTPPPQPDLEKAVPVLHASWKGDSVWGWASPNFVDDEFKIYMIRGDVTLLLDNVNESVIMTGVEIDGAESKGTFDNFKLDPGQSVTRGMQLYFCGATPQGNDYHTVQLVFKDLRGNRFPTVPHRFHPLPIPERVAIERGGHL